MKVRYKPNVTVACIIHAPNIHVPNDDKFLMVEEWIEGEQRFNQPAGHLEANESLISACEREVLEETGLSLTPSGLVGIYQFSASAELSFLRFTFCVQVDEMQDTIPQDKDISACHWLTLEQIEAKATQLRSPLVLDCLRDYLHHFQNRNTYSLELLNSTRLTIAPSGNAC
ncbi:NUDIX hydrolase [Shewanella acanthi]|uniref:NUDIX hydrolase n=1 Tax=Shewanella acanthi TaxID=2864212 RepID=UPI001C661A8B|nr:NUDIX hydrolase [Shewanella acanthi]QYJ80225.1 NUDIX hydrolase [Shewanella acanthi]